MISLGPAASASRQPPFGGALPMVRNTQNQVRAKGAITPQWMKRCTTIEGRLVPFTVIHWARMRSLYLRGGLANRRKPRRLALLQHLPKVLIQQLPAKQVADTRYFNWTTLHEKPGKGGSVSASRRDL
eukprot:5737485-Amphidinium_carterae.1